MSLSTNVSDLATSMGTELKETRVLVNGNAADLSALTTTAKSNLVAAVNEVAASAGSASGIDDAVTATTTTWSSSKITADRAAAVHTHTAGQVTGLAAVATSGSYTDLSAKPAIPSTYAELTGTVPAAALPALAITEYLGEVISEAAMLALVGQRGDWTTRTDLGTDWILIADNPALIGSWREMTTPASPVSSVNGRTGAVTGLSEAADVGPTTTNFVTVFQNALV